ncbi:hypothetical protein DITRI_Ditri17bG0004800 [Diplodiscus trichospermus]
MRRLTRKSSMGAGLGVEELLNSNPIGSFSTRFSLSSFVKRVEKLTNDQKNAIKKVGFGNLLLLPNQMLSKNLLVELMERWNSEECGFMLLPGMVKITLMDVALILGIRVIGDPVLLTEDEAFSDLESDYGAALWKRKITVASLESRLDSLGEVVDEDFVRTFILFTFGTLLFPNANGKVDSRYLSFLKDLDNIGHFAWGAAVLEDIFMWLNKRKESNVQYVGGCLILLQIWSYEHIDVGRPDFMDCLFPRACQWENSRSHQRQWFTAKFRELQDHQITWQLQPTSEELEFDVINELLEVESSSVDNSSDGCSIVGVAGQNVELVNDNSSKVHQGKEVNLKQSIASQYIPGVQKTGVPPTPCALVSQEVIGELSSLSQNSEKSTGSKVTKGKEVCLKQSTPSQHIPEVEMEAIKFPSIPCASELRKEFVELSSECQNSEKLNCENVGGHNRESDMISTSKVLLQKEQEVNLEQSTASQLIPEMQKEEIALSSTPCVSELREECGELSSVCSNSQKFMSGNVSFSP